MKQKNLQAIEGIMKLLRHSVSHTETNIDIEQFELYSNHPIDDEIEPLKKELANVVPSNNIIALVMDGLAKLRGRKLPNKQTASYSGLMRELEEILPNLLFGALFVPTASVLSAYQNLLILTGKYPDSSFPWGMWQFYVEHSARADNARHIIENTGFQDITKQYKSFDLSEVDELSAWVCAINQLYFQYDDISQVQLHEKYKLREFDYILDKANLKQRLEFASLFQCWDNLCPYKRYVDVSPDDNYVYYRRYYFNQFTENILRHIPIQDQIKPKTKVENRELYYWYQMSILRICRPDRYYEARQDVPLWLAKIGIILNNNYYFIPACTLDEYGNPVLFKERVGECFITSLQIENDTLFHSNGSELWVQNDGMVLNKKNKIQGYLRPMHFQMVRQLVTTLLSQSKNNQSAMLDEQLLKIPRINHPKAYQILKNKKFKDIELLSSAPIIINWDKQDYRQSLSKIRQNKRGIGNHALTIFRTSKAMVFDLSQIFFDGKHCISVSEILTNEAIAWANYLQSTPITNTQSHYTPYLLNLESCTELLSFRQNINFEVSITNTNINSHILSKMLVYYHKIDYLYHFDFSRRNLLLLYRFMFGFEYNNLTTIKDRIAQLNMVNGNSDITKATEFYEDIKKYLRTHNPSIALPLEAIGLSDRINMMIFQNPFTNIWLLYDATYTSLQLYTSTKTPENYARFHELCGKFFTHLSYFTLLITTHEKIARAGKNNVISTLQLLAHLPDSLRNIFIESQRRIDILNEIMQGDELIWDLGHIPPNTSISRFLGAGDDNTDLVWSFFVDNDNQIHLSLRDSRAYVTTLAQMNRFDLAEIIVTDLLDSFTNGFNVFISHLLEMITVQPPSS